MKHTTSRNTCEGLTQACVQTHDVAFEVFGMAVRVVPQVFSSVMAVLVVHRFRRAPFGGCKFWQELVEIAKIFQPPANLDHPLFEQFLGCIADDMDIPHAEMQDPAVRIQA